MLFILFGLWKDDSYLSKLLTSGDDFPLCDPLFQVVDFPVQHEQLEGVVKFGSTLRGQVPQTNVVLLNLSQTHLIARRNENIMLGTVTVRQILITTNPQSNVKTVKSIVNAAICTL